MSIQKQKTSVGFNLLQIKTEEFAINDRIFSAGKKVSLSSGFAAVADNNEKVISVFMKFAFAQKKDAPFITVGTSCHFKIDDQAWSAFSRDNKKLIVPKGFARHLGVFAVGTTRGILHCKLESTPFNAFVLPPINVVDLIEDDLHLDMM